MPHTRDTATAGRRLPGSSMVFYAIGQNAEGIQSAAFHTFLLFYYQQVIGVSGTLTGVALALALLADAITDPIAGSISDQTRTRFGRRHPYIVGATLPLALSFTMLFNPPGDAPEMISFLWLLTFAVCTRISLTFYQIPHLALGAELTDSTVRRSSLYNVAALARLGGEGVVPLIAYLLFFPTTAEFNPGTLNGDGYLWFSVFFAAWMVTVILTSAVGTAPEIPHLKNVARNPGGRWFSGYGEMLEALGNRSFRSLFYFIFAFGLVTSVTGVVSPFMAFHFWGLTTEQLALIVILAAPAVLPTMFVVPWLTHRFDRREILVGSTIWMLIVTSWAVTLRLAGVDWFPGNDSEWVFVIILANTACYAFSLPIFLSASDSMMADIADEIDLETGHRREGVLFAARAFTSKATGSLGLFVGGVLLDVIRFPENAAVGSVSETTVWQLGLIAGPATSALLLLSLIFLRHYRLTRQHYRAIRGALRDRDDA